MEAEFVTIESVRNVGVFLIFEEDAIMIFSRSGEEWVLCCGQLWRGPSVSGPSIDGSRQWRRSFALFMVSATMMRNIMEYSGRSRPELRVLPRRWGWQKRSFSVDIEARAAIMNRDNIGFWCSMARETTTTDATQRSQYGQCRSRWLSCRGNCKAGVGETKGRSNKSQGHNTKHEITMTAKNQ